MEDKTIKFEVTLQEAEMVIMGVGELPINRAGRVFSKLQDQFREQIMALNAPKALQEAKALPPEGPIK